MRFTKQLLTVSIALACAGLAQAAPEPAKPVTPAPTTQAASPLTESSVRQLLAGAGYTEVNDVKFTEGVWTADAKSADGNHVEVKVDANGKILPDAAVANITKDQVIIKMQKAGYTKVHDVEFEGGVWKAEAVDSNGKDVEVKLDPKDGHILGSEQDKINNGK